LTVPSYSSKMLHEMTIRIKKLMKHQSVSSCDASFYKSQIERALGLLGDSLPGLKISFLPNRSRSQQEETAERLGGRKQTSGAESQISTDCHPPSPPHCRLSLSRLSAPLSRPPCSV
ncbi:hypothetical protein ILYODFUR_027910, partial [Ilyodon furcidens]